MKRYRIETKTGAFIGVIEGKRTFRKWLEENGKYNPLWTRENLKLVEVKESHKTEYSIFDSYDTCSDQNMKEAKENIIENAFFNADDDGFLTVTDEYGKEVRLTREEYGNHISDQRIQNECYELESLWFEDEKYQLKMCSDGPVLAIADLGLWNGRRCGYKELQSLEAVMYTSCDYQRIYVDSNGDLRKEESHHDGNNSILYRYWKDGLTETQRNNFLDKLYNGEATQKDITRYTRKAGVDVAKVYGWKVRGSKKVA